MDIKNICQTKQTCRICGSKNLKPVVDLGGQCISSVFVNDQFDDRLQSTYPLELVRCADPGGCELVQLRHSISPRVLYDYYGYRSGINEAMQRNLQEIADTAASMVSLKAGDIVCDIGCNDGTLLDSFKSAGTDLLGIDPAPNVVAFAREKGIEVVCDFFSKRVYEAVRPGKKAKIITSIAMFYDLDAPAGFVRDVAEIMADDGVWVVEMVYLPSILKNNAFDAICHEHLAYYTLRQVEWLLLSQNLAVYKIELNNVNGGSIRLFIRKQTAGPVSKETVLQLEQIRTTELALMLDSDIPYKKFYQSICAIRKDLRRLLKRLHSDGKTVYIYGASTKGNTVLQFCGIDERLVPKAADRNPEKWSTKTPATNIEIISENQARDERPDYFLALPWHFIKEFCKREAAFLARGGLFIIPLPEVKVLGEMGDDEISDFCSHL